MTRASMRGVILGARSAAAPQRGAVLLASLLILSMVVVLGIFSLTLSAQGIEGVRAANREAAARHLAEAGADLVIQWFHAPASRPAGAAAALFVKQYDDSQTGPSFFDDRGRSQFRGSREFPDLLLDASHLAGMGVLPTTLYPGAGVVQQSGRLSRVTVSAPSSPGLLCTIEATGTKGKFAKRVTVQLGALKVPALRTAVQIGTGTFMHAATPEDGSLPVWVHWGDLKARGDVYLGRSQDIPAKHVLAAVTGRSYAEMVAKEDRWVDLWIGGQAYVDGANGLHDLGASGALPGNLHPGEDPAPGLRLDVWEYEMLKEVAKRYGSYYVHGVDGLLYEDGIAEPGRAYSPDAVMSSTSVGDRRGLVFVDTWDQRRPGSANMGSLALQAPYIEGVLVVNAHVVWSPRGPGRSVEGLAPPPGSPDASGERMAVQLHGVNLRGVLYVTGDLTVNGHPRVYGAVVAAGRIRRGGQTENPLEVWYDHDLARGVLRGVPSVYLAPGTYAEHPL